MPTSESNRVGKVIEVLKNKCSFFEDLLIQNPNKEDIYPYLTEAREDIIGQFYHEFLKYSSSSDGKVLGILLTPSHIAELFCDLALKLLYPKIPKKKRRFTKNDRILDICCGTGTFLVSALSKGANRNNLYGIETEPDICDLALTNMILWGDGKSHIYQTDCFDKNKEKEEEKVEQLIKEEKCNIGFINPPYSLKKSKKSEGKSEIEFIHHLCNLLEPKSIVIAIVPLSVATGSTDKEERKAIMKEHTLKAVMTMPSNLFSGNNSGSHTCIMIWETGAAHEDQTQTWLANWKDDGFIVRKGKREPRTDGVWEKKDIWKEREKEWLKMYWQKPIRYISTLQNLTAKESEENSKKINSNTCWLADAYIETDYTPITKKGGEIYFEKTIRDYLAFLISNFQNPRQIDALDISNWKYFYLGDETYFKIFRGKWKEALSKTSPKILFDYDSVISIISSSQQNNGINNFIKKSEREDIKTNSKNLITIANNGSVGETFLQPLEFQATSDVTVLELMNQELNEYIAFFLCSIIKMERFRYSWGRKWGLEEMRNSRIKLPQDKEGKPDWKFMENYSKKIFSKVKENIYQILEAKYSSEDNKLERERERERERAKVNNSAPKWEEIELNDYFYVEGTKTTKKENVEPGEFSYISNKNSSNGYECSSYLGTEDGNVISVSDFGAGAFYQETKFSCTYHVEKIWPKDKELNKYTALFLTTLLNWGANKYSYGRIRNLSELRKETMLLPLKDKKIDWEWIESFMKNLYKEAAVDLEKELENIENKIIWRIVKG